MDRVTKYQQVLLQDISWLEQGTAELSTAGSLFKQSSRSLHHCLRIHYSADCQPGYFHMFRSAHIRFFNNVAVEIRSQEEMIGQLMIYGFHGKFSLLLFLFVFIYWYFFFQNP